MKIKTLFSIVSALAIVNGSIYPRSGIVSNVDRAADTVEFVDCIGEKWSFKGVEDWNSGDHVNTIIFDMGTENITDDVILCARYEC